MHPAAGERTELRVDPACFGVRITVFRLPAGAYRMKCKGRSIVRLFRRIGFKSLSAIHGWDELDGTSYVGVTASR